MEVTSIKVSFRRSKQPASYEAAEPAVELSATLDEGEDATVAAFVLMTTAVRTVYAGIGFDIPEKVAAKLLDGMEVPDGGSAEAGPAAPADTPDEKPKRKRRAKAEIAADKKAAEEAEKAAEKPDNAPDEPPTDAELTALAGRASKATSADRVRELLKSYNSPENPLHRAGKSVRRMADMDAEQRLDVKARLEELLA